MATEKNYLSEFEQEWNSGFETPATLNDEFETGDEEFESGPEDEFETNGEFESDDEFEVTGDDSEFEFEAGDEEFENYEGINREFEDRLYSTLKGNHESELEFEQELNEVLHEIEKDYFWGSLKKKWNKVKNSNVFKTLKKFADKTPLGDAIKQYTALARGDIKGMLKGLAGQALTAAVPGGGIAKKLLNLEAPAGNGNLKQSAKMINQVAKDAYDNLINQLGTINPNQLSKVKDLGKMAYNQAYKRVSMDTRTNGNVRRITLRKGQKLVVRVI